MIISAYFASLAKEKTRGLFLELRKRAEKEAEERARLMSGMVIPEGMKTGKKNCAVAGEKDFGE